MNKYTFIRNMLIVIALMSTNIYGQSKYQKYFDKYLVNGSTTIYDYKNQEWIFSDSIDANQGTLPASTFKILNSLIALEENAVFDEYEIVPWDGIERFFFGIRMDIWNKDTNLKTAFNNSTIWFYEEIAKIIGKTKYRQILEECRYGNQILSEQDTDFWNFGEFAISPKNQVKFLINLYENKLPFSPSSVDKVKQIMISDNTEKYTLRDKTGWTKKDGKDIGWWVGYVETKSNIYFFATRITKDIAETNSDFSLARKEITKSILNELGVSIN